MTLAPEHLQGMTVVDSSGHKVGSVSAVYLDNDTGALEWALVHTGLLGTRSSFIPLAEASADGDRIRVPYATEQIKGAPNVDAGAQLSQQEEADLYAHYGLDYSDSRSDTGLPAGAPGLTVDMAAGGESAAVTRSEEELRVETRSVEAGRVRLRKWVDVEPTEVQVHTRRETARLESQPVNQPVEGVAMGETEIEITLSREEPVVEKRTVAKERIDLVKGVTTEHEQVRADLRKERVEVEGSADQQ